MNISIGLNPTELLDMAQDHAAQTQAAISASRGIAEQIAGDINMAMKEFKQTGVLLLAINTLTGTPLVSKVTLIGLGSRTIAEIKITLSKDLQIAQAEITRQSSNASFQTTYKAERVAATADAVYFSISEKLTSCIRAEILAQMGLPQKA